MKNNTKIYNRFKGFTLEDCDCRYCLYYGGRRKGKVNCLADECVCAEEIRQAKESYRRERSLFLVFSVSLYGICYNCILSLYAFC